MKNMLLKQLFVAVLLFNFMGCGYKDSPKYQSMQKESQ